MWLSARCINKIELNKDKDSYRLTHACLFLVTQGIMVRNHVKARSYKTCLQVNTYMQLYKIIFLLYNPKLIFDAHVFIVRKPDKSMWYQRTELNEVCPAEIMLFYSDFS